MAAAVAGGAGGAGEPPNYPWRGSGSKDLPPPPKKDEEEEEEEEDEALSNFSRPLCKNRDKHEYLCKGGCANPSCVSR